MSGRNAGPVRRSVVWAAILALVAVTGLAGCGVPTDPDPHTITPPPPFRVSETAPTAAATTGAVEKILYLTRERDRTVVKVPRSTDRSPTAEELLDDLTRGPNAAERDQGLSSALAGTVFEGPSVTLQGGIITVEVGERLDGLSANTRVLAYAQIVCTLSELPIVTGVLFSSSGELVSVPNGDGTSTSTPLSMSDYATVLAPA